MKPDQERVKALLTDTVTLLCKNGLHYNKEMKVQGLLGITLDESDVFVVHINEKFGDLIGSAGVSLAADEEGTVDTKDIQEKQRSPGQRSRKRRSSRDSSGTSQPNSPSSAHSSATDPAVKIKKEEHDVLLIDDDDETINRSCAKSQRLGGSGVGRDDRNAMQQTYSGLNLTEIEGEVTNTGVMFDAARDSGGPFVTGMVLNQGESPGKGGGSNQAPWSSSNHPPPGLPHEQAFGARLPGCGQPGYRKPFLHPPHFAYSGRKERSRFDQNKAYKCPVEGCGKSFHHMPSLCRHKRIAHAHSYSQRNTAVMSMTSFPQNHSCTREEVETEQTESLDAGQGSGFVSGEEATELLGTELVDSQASNQTQNDEIKTTEIEIDHSPANNDDSTGTVPAEKMFFDDADISDFSFMSDTTGTVLEQSAVNTDGGGTSGREQSTVNTDGGGTSDRDDNADFIGDSSGDSCTSDSEAK